MRKFLAEADLILDTWKAGHYEDCPHSRNLFRFLSQQTIVGESVHRLCTREDGGMHSDMLHDPSDPESTFREKADKPHHGFEMNFEESVGEECVLHQRLRHRGEQCSYVSILESHLQGMEKQEKPTALTAEGACFSEKSVRALPKGTSD